MSEELLSKVRLQDYQLRAIIDNFKKFFPEDDHLWLFGSRADLSKKGGDIDLYIESTISELDDVKQRQNDLISAIWKDIGEQKIDIVVNMITQPYEKLVVYSVAKEKGVQLL